eukprot:scaffold4550_cov128-Isochrysis_galbana.AAC.1
MLSWCFPCCCPPATSSLVTSELKLIDEPRSVRPGFRQRLQSEGEDDPGLCSDSEVLDPGTTSACSSTFLAAGDSSPPQRSDKLMLLGSQTQRRAGEDQRSLRTASGEVGNVGEHWVGTKGQRKTGWKDGGCVSLRPPSRPALLPQPRAEARPCPAHLRIAFPPPPCAAIPIRASRWWKTRHTRPRNTTSPARSTRTPSRPTATCVARDTSAGSRRPSPRRAANLLRRTDGSVRPRS